MVIVDQRLGDDLPAHDQLAVVVVAIHDFLHAQVAAHVDVGAAATDLARMQRAGHQQQGAGVTIGIHQRAGKVQVALDAQAAEGLALQACKGCCDAAVFPAGAPVQRQVAVERQIARVQEHRVRGAQP